MSQGVDYVALSRDLLERFRARTAEGGLSPIRRNLLTDFQEFRELGREQMEEEICHWYANGQKEWIAQGDDWQSRARRFYGSSYHYIYALMIKEMDGLVSSERLDPLLMVLGAERGVFLDYGGGIGGLSIVLHELGKDVTYLDVPGEHFRFAAYRFGKYGYTVPMLTADPDHPALTGSYDVIFSDAVLEHLPAVEAALREMFRCLRPGGLLCHFVDPTIDDALYPMHGLSHFRRVRETLDALPLTRTPHPLGIDHAFLYRRLP